MNKVILIGNLTRDPETNTTNSGIKVCKFTIAVNRNYSSVDGTRQTDFLPVICCRAGRKTAGSSCVRAARSAFAVLYRPAATTAPTAPSAM